MVCDRRDVFAVLRDGWLYPTWVVGAARIRDVDATWPDVGSRLMHSVGSWPLLVSDYTEVEGLEDERMLQLRARGWPAGEARVRIELDDHRQGVQVLVHEDAINGPGTLVPSALRGPLIGWRNTETLRRLAFLAERHARS